MVSHLFETTLERKSDFVSHLIDPLLAASGLLVLGFSRRWPERSDWALADGGM